MPQSREPVDWVVEKIRSQMIAIAHLNANVNRLQEERRWRDATAELPEEWTEVLVHRRNIGFERARYDIGLGEWYTDDGDIITPTHWMPLPAPPEKKA